MEGVGIMDIYVASSWKKTMNHEEVVKALRDAGHEVFNYREIEVADGHKGFAWRDIDEHLTENRARWWKACMTHPTAKKGFGLDMEALMASDAVVMVLPCGKNAHMELAYGVGAGKLTVILQDDPLSEPELMYNMVDKVCMSIGELLDYLESINPIICEHQNASKCCTLKNGLYEGITCPFETSDDCPCLPVAPRVII